MNWLDIYNRALRQTHTDSDDYTPTEANLDLDLRFQELVDEIVSVTKGDYYWDRGLTSTVVNQSEYVAEKLGLAPNDLDIKKINKVFIKYNDSQEFLTRVRYQNPWALDKHPDYYKTHQSKIDPFFYIQDNSIFIYPAPDAAIANWLELYVIHKPKAITTDSTEDEIELPTQFHKLLSDWLRIDIYLSKGLENEANAAQARYNAWIRNMISIMKERYNNPIKKTFKNNLINYR